MNKHLFSNNFLLLLCGQAFSMFGNNIIRFSISLFILESTESAAIYGTITAISYIPSIILSPIGGVLADRGDRKWLMVILDGTYAVITLTIGIIFQRQGTFILTGILLIILSMVSSLEEPVSSTCIPLIQDKDYLTKSIAISNQISSLSGLITPLLAGILYSAIGGTNLHNIMYLCTALFLFAAGIELFLKIPKPKMENQNTVAEIIRGDLSDILKLVFKEKKYIGETMILNGILMFLVTPYLSIGMTYLISVKLQLSAVWNGSAQVITGIAAILGAVASALISEKFQTKNLYQFLVAMGVSFIIIIPALLGTHSPITSFLLISLTSAAILLMANMAGVYIIAGMQKACPQNMLGRLMALFNVCNNLILPIGIWIHGIIYEKCETQLHFVFLTISILTILTAVKGKSVYSKLQNGST